MTNNLNIAENADNKEKQKVWTIYKIINLINYHIYIGVHKTECPLDNYMGSGNLIRLAINKYGVENFKKEIIAVFNNAEDAYALEAEIVNEDFVARKDTYNIALGGHGSKRCGEYKRKPMLGMTEEQWADRNRRIAKSLTGKPHPWQDKINKNPVKIAKMAAKHRGMKRSAEAKQKMRERKLGKLDGTIWISNELLRQEKQVFKDSELFKKLWDDGWKMGRLYGTSSWLHKKCFTTS